MREGNKLGWLFGFSFWMVIMLPLATCCGLMGVILAFGSWDLYRQANRVEAMQPISATALQASPNGQEVLIAGRISAENAPGFGRLVAYEVEQRDDDTDTDSSTDWETIREETPALQIELTDGVVWLEAGYQLEQAPTEFIEGERRYTGFQADDIVLALGVVVEGREGKALDAEFLYGGTQAQYVTEKRELAALLPWCGSPFLLIAGMLVLVGVLWVVLGVRALKQRRDVGQTGEAPGSYKKVVR